jgi:hypothetical protein
VLYHSNKLEINRINETFLLQQLMVFFYNNAKFFTGHTIRLQISSRFSAFVVRGLLGESALQVHALELEVRIYLHDQDIRQMLESLHTLSIRTSNVRVRLTRNRKITDEWMLNSLLHWVHGNAEQQQVATDSATIQSPPSSQIHVPQQHQQPHRTLSIDFYSLWDDYSCTKDAEDFVSKIMKVNTYISFNVCLL